jgi:hypothetical protein
MEIGGSSRERSHRLDEDDARGRFDLRREEPGARMPKTAQRMVMVGMIAGWRRQLVAGDRRRIGGRGRREAERVLAERREVANIGGYQRRLRRRPGKAQAQRQHGENDGQPARRPATLTKPDPGGSSARHIRPQPAFTTSRIARITGSASRGQVTTKSPRRQSGDDRETRFSAAALRRRHRRPLSSACHKPIVGNPIAMSRARFSKDNANAISGVRPKVAPSRM